MKYSRHLSKKKKSAKEGYTFYLLKLLVSESPMAIGRLWDMVHKLFYIKREDKHQLYGVILIVSGMNILIHLIFIQFFRMKIPLGTKLATFLIFGFLFERTRDLHLNDKEDINSDENDEILEEEEIFTEEVIKPNVDTEFSKPIGKELSESIEKDPIDKQAIELVKKQSAVDVILELAKEDIKPARNTSGLSSEILEKLRKSKVVKSQEEVKKTAEFKNALYTTDLEHVTDNPVMKDMILGLSLNTESDYDAPLW